MRLHPQIQVLCMSLLLQEHGNGSRKLGPNLLRTNNVNLLPICQKNAPHGIWGTRMISGFVWTARVTNKAMADRQIYDEDNNNDDCQHNKLDFEVLEPHLASQLLSLSLKVISLQWKHTIRINPQKRQLYFKTSKKVLEHHSHHGLQWPAAITHHWFHQLLIVDIDKHKIIY